MDNAFSVAHPRPKTGHLPEYAAEEAYSDATAERKNELYAILRTAYYTPRPQNRRSTDSAEESQQMQPSSRLLQILTPSVEPCSHMDGACSGAVTWDPRRGHMPRGSVGATGNLSDVRLVLLTAEPGDPYPGESYIGDTADQRIKETFSTLYNDLRRGADQFWRNLRDIIDLCFPDKSLDEQLRQVWMTDTVRCGAAHEGGELPLVVRRTCGRTYLGPQLQAMEHAVIAALGKKAQNRVRWLARQIDIPNPVVAAFHPAPPGCNFRGAYPSWLNLAEVVHQEMRKHGRAVEQHTED